MSTSRSLTVSLLLLCACVLTGSDDTGASSETSSGSATAPTTTTDAESTSTSTADASTSTTDADSTTAAESSETTPADSSSSTTEPVAFEVTSTEFVEGGGLPHTAHVDGGNQSPDLAWVGAPAGTMSFAVFFHDITIDFDHSAIWNIPGDQTGLPHDVDHDAMPADVLGAVQCQSWAGEYGYGGPGSPANMYEFIVYAIDVETIPETEITSESPLGEVFAALEAHSLGTATIVGQSTGP